MREAKEVNRCVEERKGNMEERKGNEKGKGMKG